MPLQRAVTDFAADVSFAQTMDKLVEHYGVLLGESTIRRITQGHARRMFEAFTPQASWPEEAGCEVVIAEMDGGMVPIVASDEAQPDRRKGKHLHWKEAKLCLAHAQGDCTPVYGGTLQGGVESAGQALFDCATRAGSGRESHLHAVGDGAEWIALQVEERFGAQGGYLIDFYHVCDYLAAAGKALHTTEEAAVNWIQEQKTRLKTVGSEQLLQTLKPHREPGTIPDEESPIRCCYRYLSQRLNQLDYPQALAQELPIGSGEIESAHRYVVQQRLKRPGAWWRIENAEHMLALRLNRANKQWSAYWDNELPQAA